MSAEVREQRLQEGCCPNCGTQLYKITTQSKANVMSKMSMFNNKSSNLILIVSARIRLTGLPDCSDNDLDDKILRVNAL